MGQRVWRWVPRAALAGVLAYAALHAGTWRRLARAHADALAAERAAAAARFAALPGLSGAAARALGQPRNADHLAAARRLGIAPVGPLDSLDAAADRAGLARLDGPGYVATQGRFSRPRLVPVAARVLDSLAAAFQDSLRARGLPRVRLVVTSALRSTDSQQALAEVNAAATRGVSAHTFGTTFDVTYRRFAYAGPHAADSLSARVPPGLPAPLRAWAAARAHARRAETLGPLVDAHAAGLDALLGRVALAQQQRGRLFVLRERTQPVYHLTAAADPAAEADGGARR